MSRSFALFQLQQFDSTLDQTARRLAEINAQLGESAEVNAAQSTLVATEKKLADTQRQVNQLATQAADLRAKRKRSEERMYSGTVTNPKELQDLQAEIKSLTRNAAELDDQQLDAMVALEELDALADEQRDALETLQDAWLGGQSDLLAEKRELEAQAVAVTPQRDRQRGLVAAADLAAYDKLRKSKRGVAVTVISSAGVCGACGMSPSSALRQKASDPDALLNCPTCGRIWHRE